MANHGYVKTQNRLKIDRITEILNELNKTRFKGGLVIEQQKGGWGEYTWGLKYISNEDKNEWGSRVCWLEKQRTFEMRHGGGNDFMWWIDFSIINAVALEYDGWISDDGDDSRYKGEPDKYLTYENFLRNGIYKHQEGERQIATMQFAMELTPPEHRIDLGPRIEIRTLYPPSPASKIWIESDKSASWSRSLQGDDRFYSTFNGAIVVCFSALGLDYPWGSKASTSLEHNY